MTVPSAFLEIPLFEHLSAREKAVLYANATLLRFDQEEMFIKNEILLFSIFYIYEGEVKIKNEHNQLIDLLGATDFLGFRYLFNEDPVFFSGYGTKGTQIIQFDKNIIKQFVLTNSKFMSEVYNRSMGNVSALTERLLSYKTHKINGSLADFLLHYHAKNCLRFLKQKEISEVLGYSREIVCKCMKDFTNEGYISYDDDAITIHNIDALKAIKGFG